jgi:hypothetical protein
MQLIVEAKAIKQKKSIPYFPKSIDINDFCLVSVSARYKSQSVLSEKSKKHCVRRCFLGDYLAKALTTKPLINRKPGSSKTLVNQQVASKNSKRVIFRVIE